MVFTANSNDGNERLKEAWKVAATTQSVADIIKSAHNAGNNNERSLSPPSEDCQVFPGRAHSNMVRMKP